MTDTFDIERAMRFAQWERALGELNACLAMSARISQDDDASKQRIEKHHWFERAVQDLKDTVFSNGLAY